MKKLLSFVFLSVVFAGSGFGQSKPQGYLSLTFGPSIPLGNYASTADVSTGGFATPGSVAVLDWAKYYSNFGMTATMSFGSHGLNESALDAVFAEQGEKPVYSDSSNWMSSCLMFGPAYGLRFDKLTLDFNILGGLYFAKSPDVRLQNEQSIPLECNKFNNNFFDCVVALGYQLSAAMRYNICNHFFATAKTRFYHSNPSYTIGYDLPTDEKGGYKNQYKFSQPTSVLDFTVGIGIGF